MPHETKAIEPALTPEEWKHDERVAAFAREPGSRLLMGDRDDDRSCHRLMALANAALPDDDPRKITRDDIVLLLNLSRGIATFYNQGDERNMAVRDQTRALAAKLAAFLPPE